MKKIDLIIFPFHDYKKYEKEGFRTRDAHLLKSFQNIDVINKILMVNRPVSISEMIIKGRNKFIDSGIPIFKNKNYQISKVSPNTFVLDIFVKEVFTPLFLRLRWWETIFNKKWIQKIINESISFLEMENNVLFFQNPVTVKISKNIKHKLTVFDAIDNWTIHPQMKLIHGVAAEGYKYVKQNFDLIFTNSNKLKEFLANEKTPPIVIPNGVDVDKFRKEYDCPKDLIKIKRPIVGYAGKLQQRFDVDLMKKMAFKFPKVSFVIIGQLLDKKWMRPIKNINNIYYLGDKHYSQVPSYVTNFDICIIPHNVGKGEVDGDAIKLYEYLAAKKPVITTKIGGVNVFKDHIYIAENHKNFMEHLQYLINNGIYSSDYSISQEHTWDFKAQKIINKIFEKLS